MQRMLYLPLLVVVILLAAGWATKPSALKPASARHTVDGDLDALLRKRESVVAAALGVIPGAEKRIRWAGEVGERTPLVVIYLHGFSATRQEIAPVPEQVAAALGANLFETRLAGHGVERNAMVKVTAEQWLEDGSEALAIGRALGDRLIIIGTSTGATLAVALAQHPDFEAVEALVLLSPNFGPAAEGSEITTGPFGPQLTRVMLGKYREWEPANAQQGRYWSTRYPTASLVEMMRLVNLAVALTPQAGTAKALLIYSPDDQVVSVERLLKGFEALPANSKSIHIVQDGGGPSRHVLTGDILAPENTAPTAALITAFLNASP